MDRVVVPNEFYAASCNSVTVAMDGNVRFVDGGIVAANGAICHGVIRLMLVSVRVKEDIESSRTTRVTVKS